MCKCAEKKRIPYSEVTPCDCRKVAYRIECHACYYPFCEAQWPDGTPPLPCNAEDEVYERWIEREQAFWDLSMQRKVLSGRGLDAKVN